jgi:hypothetical protein
MCNIERISALIIAAEVTALVALACILVAVGASTNIFTAFGSPPLMIAASISLAISVATLSAAAAATAQCMTGQCETGATVLFYTLLALVAALGGLLTAVIIGTWGTAIPGAGSIIAGALAAGLWGQLLLWPAVALLLGPLARCVGTPATTPVVAVAIVLAIIIAVVVGTLIPKAPCGPFC